MISLHLFVGRDPLAIERHARTLETISFHAGRYWPLEAALWDLFGQACGQPVASLLGGARSALPAYASLGLASRSGLSGPRTPWRWSRRAFGRSRSGSRRGGPMRGSAWSPRSATRSATRSRSSSTSTSGGGWRATSGRGSASLARGGSSSGCAPTALCGSRSRCRARTSAGCGLCARRRGCGSAAVRWRGRSRSCAWRWIPMP